MFKTPRNAEKKAERAGTNAKRTRCFRGQTNAHPCSRRRSHRPDPCCGRRSSSGAASRHTCRASSAPPSGSRGRGLAEAEAARVEAAARRRAAEPKDRGSIEHYRSRDSERPIEERRQLATEDLIIHYHSSELLLLPSMAVGSGVCKLFVNSTVPIRDSEWRSYLEAQNSVWARNVASWLYQTGDRRRSEKATSACVLAWCGARRCSLGLCIDPAKWLGCERQTARRVVEMRAT
jgi:hypothetical protein